MKNTECVVVVGSLTNGFEVYGPHKDFDEAAASREGQHPNAWIMRLKRPRPLNEQRPQLFPPFEVRRAEKPIPIEDLPNCLTEEGERYLRDWDLFVIGGERGEAWFDEGVEWAAEQQGIFPAFCAGEPFALQTIDESNTKRGDNDEDVVAEAVAAGITLVKLPDRIGSPYFRWYAVDVSPKKEDGT